MIKPRHIAPDIEVMSPDGNFSTLNEVEFALLRADIAEANESGWMVISKDHKGNDVPHVIYPNGRMNDWSWFDGEHRFDSALMRILAVKTPPYFNPTE